MPGCGARRRLRGRYRRHVHERARARTGPLGSARTAPLSARGRARSPRRPPRPLPPPVPLPTERLPAAAACRPTRSLAPPHLRPFPVSPSVPRRGHGTPSRLPAPGRCCGRGARRRAVFRAALWAGRRALRSSLRAVVAGARRGAAAGRLVWSWICSRSVEIKRLSVFSRVRLRIGHSSSSL